MFRVWIFLVLAAVGCSLPICKSKGINRDSLMHYVNTLPNDTSKIDTLIALSYRVDNQGRGISLELLQVAKELAEKFEDKNRTLKSLMGISAEYGKLNLLNQALEYLLEARDIAEEIDNKIQLAWIFNRIGNAHKDKKNYDQARQYYNEASRRLKDLNKGEKATYPLINMASMLNTMGENDSALAIYHKVFEEYPGKPSSYRNVIVYNNLGNLYRDMGQFNKAKDYLHLSLKLKAQRGDEFLLPNTTNNLANMYIQMGRADSAEYYLDSTRRVCSRLEIIKYTDETLQLEADLANLKGDHKTAYVFLNSLKSRTDSIHDADRAGDMENLFALFEKDRQATKIQLLEKENDIINSRSKNQLLAILGLVIVLILLSIIFFINYRLSQKLKDVNQDLSLKNNQIKDQQDEILLQNETVVQKNQKLEDLVREKDGIIQFVAHDLKAPINKTLALLDMIGNDMDGQKAQLLGMIKESNLNAQALIKDLLMINSVEQDGNEMIEERINLNDLIQKKIRSFKIDADRKSIKLYSLLRKGVPDVNCPESDLSRILDNFISNALKFSNPGSSVEVGIRERREIDEGITLFVKDEGPGISPEDQEKMFKKFQKLSARPTGGESSHGLGLAIVKSLAEKIGGEIRFESEIGKGTTFEVLIPA